MTRVALALGLCCAAAAIVAGDDSQQTDFSRVALDRRAPIVAEQTYTLRGGVRMLVFWIHRDNVGSGRITWRAGHDGHRALEFLVGSDPARAPRHINRWGYIAEEVRPPNAELLGIMSKSDDASVDDAESQVAAEGQSASHAYRGIRTTIRDGSASGGVFHLLSPQALTYRDLDNLLGRLPTHADAPRTVAVPKGTQPGFLFAVEELITGTLEQCRVGLQTEPAPVPYVYNNTFYTLQLSDCAFDSRRTIAKRVFTNVIRAELQTTNTVTRARTSFRLEYGASGALAAVPLRIVFRPKWWFEAELLLDDQGANGAVRR